MSSAHSQTLLQAITRSLATLPGTLSLKPTVLRSTPHRTSTLFPHHSDPTSSVPPKIWVEEILITVSEQSSSGEWVLLVGIELYLYLIPSTSHSILYVSKVDTTGLQSSTSTSPSPTSSLLQASFEHLLSTPAARHGMETMWLQLFARAEPAYLFPLSEGNEGKKALSDRGLCGWWRCRVCWGSLNCPISSPWLKLHSLSLRSLKPLFLP